MDVTSNVGGNDRRTRAALAVLFSVAALRAFRAQKPKRGLLLLVGALVAGFTASTRFCPVNDALGIDTSGEEEDGDVDIEIEDSESETDAEDSVSVEISETDSDEGGNAAVATTAGGQRTVSERATLTCAFCGDPIVPGQGRGPNAQGDVVHDTCE